MWRFEVISSSSVNPVLSSFCLTITAYRKDKGGGKLANCRRKKCYFSNVSSLALANSEVVSAFMVWMITNLRLTGL